MFLQKSTLLFAKNIIPWIIKWLKICYTSPEPVFLSGIEDVVLDSLHPCLNRSYINISGITHTFGHTSEPNTHEEFSDILVQTSVRSQRILDIPQVSIADHLVVSSLSALSSIWFINRNQRCLGVIACQPYCSFIGHFVAI